MIRVVAAIIVRGSCVLAARRRPGVPRGDLWEFPGGKVEVGEADEHAVVREIVEELSLRVEVVRALGSVVHHYNDVSIELVAYLCRTTDREDPVAREHAELGWFDAGALGHLAWAPADVPLLDAVAAVLGSGELSER